MEPVRHVFDRMLEAVAADPDASAAGIAAATSNVPAANAPEHWRNGAMLPYLEAAFGNEEPGTRDHLGQILGPSPSR
jgi:hypothetical protein